MPHSFGHIYKTKTKQQSWAKQPTSMPLTRAKTPCACAKTPYEATHTQRLSTLNWFSLSRSRSCRGSVSTSFLASCHARKELQRIPSPDQLAVESLDVSCGRRSRLCQAVALSLPSEGARWSAPPDLDTLRNS